MLLTSERQRSNMVVTGIIKHVDGLLVLGRPRKSIGLGIM